MADPPKRSGGVTGTGETGELDEVAAHLLPGWSSLVILLTLFAVISGVSLLVILRGEEAHVTPESGGTRAFGPADFPEIEFDAPLLAGVAEAGADRAGGIIVPPPPF